MRIKLTNGKSTNEYDLRTDRELRLKIQSYCEDRSCAEALECLFDCYDLIDNKENSRIKDILGENISAKQVKYLYNQYLYQPDDMFSTINKTLNITGVQRKKIIALYKKARNSGYNKLKSHEFVNELVRLSIDVIKDSPVITDYDHYQLIDNDKLLSSNSIFSSSSENEKLDDGNIQCCTLL